MLTPCLVYSWYALLYVRASFDHGDETTPNRIYVFVHRCPPFTATPKCTTVTNILLRKPLAIGIFYIFVFDNDAYQSEEAAFQLQYHCTRPETSVCRCTKRASGLNPPNASDWTHVEYSRNIKWGVCASKQASKGNAKNFKGVVPSLYGVVWPSPLLVR